jgi:uncharacterized membrane protein
MYCGNCGKQIEDGMAFCPSCGKSIGASTQGSAGQTTQGNAGQTTAGNTGQTTQGSVGQTTAGDNSKTMSIIAYIWFFVPLLAGAPKTSEAVKFHTNQGLVLIIAAIIYSIVYGILTGILTAALMWEAPGVAGFLIALLGIPYLGYLALWITGIVNAAKGRQKPLPLIGKITIIK